VVLFGRLMFRQPVKDRQQLRTARYNAMTIDYRLILGSGSRAFLCKMQTSVPSFYQGSSSRCKTIGDQQDHTDKYMIETAARKDQGQTARGPFYQIDRQEGGRV